MSANKKPSVMGPPDFSRLLHGVSKAALVDALWCACQLGTDESAEQITTKAAREVIAALESRDDRVSAEFRAIAARRIDSDPEVA